MDTIFGHTPSRRSALARGAALVASVVSFCAPALAGAPPTPDGFTGFAVFVSDGEYELGTPHPEIPGCDVLPGTCDGNYFWYDVLGATPEEVSAVEADAKQFMLQRYGLDVDAVMASGDATWVNVMADPRSDIRVRALGGIPIHEFGWQVLDQAFSLFANVDLALGGEFEGVTMETGSLLAYGRYLIQPSRLDWVDGAPVLTDLDRTALITFQSGAPMPGVSDVRSVSSGNCELTSSPWGSGVAVASILTTSRDGVSTKIGYRHVLTFDGGDGFGESFELD